MKIETNLINNRLTSIQLLRDFFNAQDSVELKKAFDAFSLPINIDEESLETLFNHYFIGPMEPIADPFASIYLDEQDVVMSESTMHIRKLYETMGFEYPLKNIVPEDFIGVELDAYYQLVYLEEIENVTYLSELREYFLHEHMAVWLMQFIERARGEQTDMGNAIHLILNELKLFLIRETRQ